MLDVKAWVLTLEPSDQFPVVGAGIIQDGDHWTTQVP
jgi:hypothetical protein